MEANSRLATAQWAEFPVILQNFKYAPGKFWLGRAMENRDVPLGYIDDRHICLVSGSRGGKGTSVIINNLCLYPGSVVVIDPKGENATVTAARRGKGSQYCEGIGQAVHVLDPFNSAQISDEYRSSFNPLDTLDPNNDESVDEAARIADALVVMSADSKDTFFNEMARQMIQGLILHVLTAPSYEGQRNLVTVRKLITSGHKQIYDEMIEEGFQDVPSAQSILWEVVSQNPAFDGIVAGIGETFFEMFKASPKTFSSVLSTANQNTNFIDSPGMRKCLSASSFQLSELKTNRRGVSLYLSLPQRYMETHYRWLRMMIGLTVTEMEKVKGKPATGHRILMCLDEFAGLRHMRVIETAVAQIAGFGVTLFFVLQSLEQLKAIYKDNWQTFLSNSGLKIFFNIEDHFTREYVSKFIGDTEVLIESETESVGENSGGSSSGRDISYDRFLFFFKRNKRFSRSNSQNTGTGKSFSRGRTVAPQKRPLVSPDEMGKYFVRVTDKNHPLYPGLALMLVSGYDPASLTRCNYYEDQFFFGKFDPHSDYKKIETIRNVDVPIEGLMPAANETIQQLSGTPKIQWLVSERQPVRKNQPIVKLYFESEKIPVNIHAPETGILKKQFVKGGTDVPLYKTLPLLGIIESSTNKIVSEWNFPQIYSGYDEILTYVHKIKTISSGNQTAWVIGGVIALVASLFFVIVFFASFTEWSEGMRYARIYSNSSYRTDNKIASGMIGMIIGGVLCLASLIGSVLLFKQSSKESATFKPNQTLGSEIQWHRNSYAQRSRNFYKNS